MWFTVWIAFSLGLCAVYAAVLGLYGHGWRRLPQAEMPGDYTPEQPVTIVVPARNEEKHLGACLDSLLAGSYPHNLLEIIVVDDFSDDRTAEIVRHFQQRHQNVRLLQLAECLPPGAALNNHKKKALETAVARASGELILTTDADCIAPPDWVKRMTWAFSARPATKILAGPVAFHREKNLLQRFQSLDMLGMTGITGAGIQLGWQRLGNGASLAYPKAVFETLGGYAGDVHASGDDLSLLQKAAQRWPDGVFFLKNAAATVRTEAAADAVSFFRQRLRWGTKNAALPEPGPKLVLLAVFCFCWTIALNLLFFRPLQWAPAWLAPAQLAVKAGCDFFFLRTMCRFFGRRDLLRAFLPAFFLHVAYIAVVGTASMFVKKYTWKGRRAA